jgi:hypothetical protein
MFWQNWVNEKMVKFRPLPRPVDVRYFHIPLKGSQNSLVSKTEKFLELALKLEKLWPK